MCRWMIVFVIFCLSGTMLAQEDALTPYEIALQRIQEAEANGETDLNLAGLGLTELPSELGNLTNLTHLYLWHNNLTSLPPELWNLTNLEILNVSNNQLMVLPPTIAELSHLQELTLIVNHITELPPEIGNLSNLEILRIGFNRLTELPPEVGNLTNLKLLELDANALTNLPPEIGRLINLCLLSLGPNELHQLPVEIGNLKKLTQSCSDHPWMDNGIFLSGNPLVSPPPEVVEQGTEAILDYLRNRAWWHLQRMIVGIASGVGVLVLLFWGLLKYRRRGQRKPKQKRDTIEVT